MAFSGGASGIMNAHDTGVITETLLATVDESRWPPPPVSAERFPSPRRCSSVRSSKITSGASHRQSRREHR